MITLSIQTLVALVESLESQIREVEKHTQRIEKQIQEVEKQVEESGGDREVMLMFMKKGEQLRKKEEQLREEQLLRMKKELQPQPSPGMYYLIGQNEIYSRV